MRLKINQSWPNGGFVMTGMKGHNRQYDDSFTEKLDEVFTDKKLEILHKSWPSGGLGGTRKGALVVPSEDWNWESRMKPFRSDKFTEVKAELFTSMTSSDNDQKKRKHEPDASSEIGLTPKARKEGTDVSSSRAVEKCGTESRCSALVSTLGGKKNCTPSRKVITPRRRETAAPRVTINLSCPNS